ncbi:MAG: T9SS type A sorting domain-containing protein [Ignavibacteria bacterium]|nr:T9SS type A sorting domain-containing protein [Ignavibacteria bacterium]
MKKLVALLFIVAFVQMGFGQFSGDYNIGTGQTYTTLKAACDALNAGTITGNCTFYITSDLTEAVNFGLGVNTAGYSITFRPDADANRTITFTSTTDNTGPSGHFVIGNPTPTVTWTDANTITTSNITIDGYASGFTTKRLTLTNASASAANARLITVVGACENTVIKNSIFINNSTSVTSPVCIVAIVRKGTVIDVAPINLTIENNSMSGLGSVVSMGMRITNSGTPTTKVTGFVFKNNVVTAKRRLLEINYTNGGNIFGNEFRSQQTGAAGTVSYGVWTSAGNIGTFNIYNNKFLEAFTEETGAFGHRVISLANTATYNIYNNMFAGLNKTKPSTAILNLTYLFFSGVAGTIYNNTFYMPALTDPTAAATGYYSAIQLSGNTATIKNNIFISDEATHTNPYFISAVPSQASDYNDFYMRQSNVNHKVVSTYTTLSAYQAANLSKDAHSKSVDVAFTSSTDLHLLVGSGSIGDDNLVGTVLSSPYNVDIDGDSRNTVYPYMGVDEITTSLIYPLAMHTVPMTSGVSNATSFGINGILGTDGSSTFYTHWDATYLYLGWSGGKTNYSSDMYYAAIDIDPTTTNGTDNAIENVGFLAGDPKPDFYVVYENNSTFYGAPATNGNAFEIYNVSGGNWNWVSRTDGDDGATSQVDFLDAAGEVRLRIPWATLGFTPATGNKLGIVMWNNNADGNYMWGRVPTTNPANASTPITLTMDFVYNNTGSGINPSSDKIEAALPVELTSFNSAVHGKEVNLTWKTATEINSYGFEIERIRNEELGIRNWEKVGFVQASGNSNSPKDYTYNDNNLQEGKYQYRLKMIDNDGTFEYSNIVEAEITLPKQFALSQNYPNPFNPVTTINYSLPIDGKVMLVVYSINGEKVAELVNEMQSAGSYNIPFSANGLASGTYIYRLQVYPTGGGAGEFVQTKKMILLK